jgi:hypothetical protein
MNSGWAWPKVSDFLGTFLGRTVFVRHPEELVERREWPLYIPRERGLFNINITMTTLFFFAKEKEVPRLADGYRVGVWCSNAIRQIAALV